VPGHDRNDPENFPEAEPAGRSHQYPWRKFPFLSGVKFMGAESVGLFIATLNMLPQWECIYDGLCLQQGNCVCETPRTVFAKRKKRDKA
jgi:hypothetical protein